MIFPRRCSRTSSAASRHGASPCAGALPPPPTPTDQRFYRHRLYLMFDPTVSLHYDVLYFPEVPEKPKPYPERRNGRSAILIRYSYDNLPPPVREAYERDVNRVGSMEWPPLSYGVQVYSSRTGHTGKKHGLSDKAIVQQHLPCRTSGPIRRHHRLTTTCFAATPCAGGERFMSIVAVGSS
jgi:hypothetical protein